MPPGFLASWYASAFHQPAPPSSGSPRNPPPKSEALSVLELRARLEVKIGRLPMAAASPREPHVKPPSHHLAEIEAVKRPTEAEVLTRCLMPLLQHTLSGDASQVLESSILDLCLEELFAVLRNRAPDLCALVHAVRVATGAALKRNDAAAGESLGRVE